MDSKTAQLLQKQPTEDPEEVFDLLCSISTASLDWSWEGTVGMEERVAVVGAAYGYRNVRSLFSAQSVQLKMGDQETIIKAGIPGIPPLHAPAEFRKILNKIIAGELSAKEAHEQVDQLRNRPSLYKRTLVILGVVLISAAFAVDIVGTWEGVMVAAITGIVAGATFVSGTHILNFDKIVPLVATFLVSFCVMVAWHLGWINGAPGLLLIPATFVFIPGDSISMQAYEMADGRWGPAVDRLGYSVMVLVLQVTGIVLAAILLNVPYADLFPDTPAHAFPWWFVYIGHVVFTIGVMLAFQMRRIDLLMAIVIVLIVTAVSQLGTIIYGGLMGTFVGAFAMTLIAYWVAKSPKRAPAYVFIITPLFLLTPGSHGLKALESMISGQSIAGVNDIQSLVGNLLAIGIAIFLARFVWNQTTFHRHRHAIHHLHLPRYHYKSKTRADKEDG
jgi:uncharacterized membrane protein YjjP (DUF1212 family)